MSRWFSKAVLEARGVDKNDALLKTMKDLRSWEELLKMEQINGFDALVWLEFCGLSVPFQWNRVALYLKSGNTTFEEAVYLFKITNISSLIDEWKHIHEQIRLSLDLYRKGCQSRSCRQFQQIILRECDDDMKATWNLSVFAGHRDVLGVTPHRFGRYHQSLEAISANESRGMRQSYRMRAVNYWFLEQYKKTVTNCEIFKPFIQCSQHPDGAWNSSILFGLQIYSLIELKRFKKARKLLRTGIRRDRFNSNSVVTFCAQKLRIKLHRMNCVKDDGWAHHVDIVWLFHGMICQYHEGNYQSAICLYHYCNFNAAHPIHFYRLFECYQMIGLYGKAFGCLRIAEFRANGTVPSIDRDFAEKVAELEKQLREIQCDVCGLSNWDEILSACSDCLSVYYCSKKCQKIGWKVKGHRHRCNKRFQGFSQRLKSARSSPFSKHSSPC